MATEQGIIISAMLAVQADIGAIAKTRKNVQQGYAFRGIEDVYSHFQPLFIKHGILCLPTAIAPTARERQDKSGKPVTHVTLEATYRFVADDGSSVEVRAAGEGMDWGDKATYKALSGAMKYALLQAFCVPVEELPDAEADSPELGKRAPAPAQRATPGAPPGADAEEAAARKRLYERMEQDLRAVWPAEDAADATARRAKAAEILGAPMRTKRDLAAIASDRLARGAETLSAWVEAELARREKAE